MTRTDIAAVARPFFKVFYFGITIGFGTLIVKQDVEDSFYIFNFKGELLFSKSLEKLRNYLSTFKQDFEVFDSKVLFKYDSFRGNLSNF